MNKKISLILLALFLLSFCNTPNKVDVDDYDIDPKTGQKKKKYEDTSDPYKVLRD